MTLRTNDLPVASFTMLQDATFKQFAPSKQQNEAVERSRIARHSPSVFSKVYLIAPRAG